MKRIILLIAFCLSLSAIYAQTIDVIHLKSGFDARGTITNRTESQITLQSENGRTLTIDMSDIDSMEQEEKAFDPRVLIGRWACYKANGERDETYDMEIIENEGFYSVRYDWILDHSGTGDRCTSLQTHKRSEDLDNEDGELSYTFHRVNSYMFNVGSRKEHQGIKEIIDSNIDLKYKDGKLRGSIDCYYHFWALGNSNYKSVSAAIEHGCGTVYADGPGGKWNVYFVKY